MDVKEASFELYIETDSCWVLVDVGKNLKRFNYNLECNQHYAFRFKYKESVKYMYIQTEMAGTIECNIDFDSEYSARIKPDKKKKFYTLAIIDPEEAVKKE